MKALLLVVFSLAIAHSQLILSGGNVTVRFNILETVGGETASSIANRMLNKFAQLTLNAGYPISSVRVISGLETSTGTTGQEENPSSDATPLKPAFLLTSLFSFLLSFTETSRKYRISFAIGIFLVSYIQFTSAFGTYQNCKLMDPTINYRLYWNVTGTDLKVGISANAVGWLGFGISRNGAMDSGTTSGVNGSDIALGFINPNYAPCASGCVNDYNAFDHNGVSRDPTNNVQFVAASEVNGATYLEFTRPLTASELNYDRAITPATPQYVLYAAQTTTKPSNEDSPSKHTIKGSQQIQFNQPSSCPNSGSVLAEIVLDIYPDNFVENNFVSALASSLQISPNQIVVSSISTFKPPVCPTCTQAEFEIPNYLIPQAETTYECYSFVMPNDTDKHIIRIEPIINNSLILHHIVVFSSDTYYPGPFSCGSMPSNTNPIYGWAPGSGPLNLPTTAGFPIGPNQPGTQYLIIQYHYNNPGLLPNQRDSSGVRFFMIPKSGQRQDAGFMFVGARNGGILIPPQKSAWHINANCSVPNLPVGVNGLRVFGVIRHAHTRGRQHWTDIYRSGNYVQKLTPSNVYDFNYQALEVIDFTITAGTLLNTHCVFDTRGDNVNILGGESTSNEMCLNAIFYYPAIPGAGCLTTPTSGCDMPC